MMTVTPVMSSSSSTATVVSMGSPENTWLGHWARSRLRMVSRRTARVKEEENRLDSEDKDGKAWGHTPPQAAQIKKGIISLLLLNNRKRKSKKTTHTHTHTFTPHSLNFRIPPKEKSQCSPSREAHP